MTASADRITSSLPSITVATAATTSWAAARTSSAPRESSVIPSVMAPSVLRKPNHHKRENRDQRVIFGYSRGSGTDGRGRRAERRYGERRDGRPRRPLGADVRLRGSAGDRP